MNSIALVQAALCCGLLLLAVAVIASPPDRPAGFRPPAVPLVAHDPYFSVWSTSDRLTDDWTHHWTGAVQAMCGMVRIDGAAYRFAGPQPADVPAMKQTSVQVLPTRTIYAFEAAGVHITLSFITPSLPDDLDVLSRPVTYVLWDVRALDRGRHAVSVYLDCTAEWAVNTPEQAVSWSRHKTGDLSVLAIGTAEQPVLAKKGDNLRIDWGHLMLAVPYGGTDDVIADADSARRSFASTGTLPEVDDARMPRPANEDWPALACTLDFGRVGTRTITRQVLLAYDDGYSLEHMGHRLRPWWRRHGMEAADLLRLAVREQRALLERSVAFDRELMADMQRAGGERYAVLGALAYRQCLAAGKLVAGEDGSALLFPKENFSNGCIGTVDVIYPAAPLFLLLSPALLKAQLTPVLDYAASPRWKFPFAPHDLGTYPLANGQVYGGGEETEENQMPVEECGNMLILLDALARVDGNADYALRYWPVITRWAGYLRAKGLDPANQLCTDDFAGHLAHNANLSLKAILALGAYADLCRRAGKDADHVEYRKAAEGMAAEWVRMADDGDHFRLAFDKPGTWSQKYNLVWDRLLGLCLFPESVARKEVAYYRTRLQRYGLPLDSRQDYTKLDWSVWTAALTGSRADFDALVTPLHDFANATQDRVSLTDWFWTNTGRKAGFQARSVVGGVFLPLLSRTSVWQKWASRGKT